MISRKTMCGQTHLNMTWISTKVMMIETPLNQTKVNSKYNVILGTFNYLVSIWHVLAQTHGELGCFMVNGYPHYSLFLSSLSPLFLGTSLYSLMFVSSTMIRVVEYMMKILNYGFSDLSYKKLFFFLYKYHKCEWSVFNLFKLIN